jgi:hypothetical protein
MMGSDKICTDSCAYVHVLSLCHLYSLPLLEELQIKNQSAKSGPYLVNIVKIHLLLPKIQ